MEYLVSDYLLLPQEPGIYLFLAKNSEVLYVGKAKNLKKRVSSYFFQEKNLGPKTKLMLSLAKKIRIIRVESEIESLLLEANFIKKYKPVYNVIMKDGKSYPLIEVTKKEEYPAVLTVRKITNKKSEYFGPFPDVLSMRQVLKTVRRIFPYQSVRRHPKKICLYYHLDLCPCASAEVTTDAKLQYKKTISYILKFLRGKSKIVIRELEKERNLLIKNEKFEEASIIQQKIEAVNNVTRPVKKPFEYEENPNLKDDLRQDELNEFKRLLIDVGETIESLERIECYDISTIQGTNSTGSLVTFINGEKDTSEYRRFKIKTVGSVGKPNDFAMIEEVLTRRFKREGWPRPDLIIVDGGKGQIASAKKVLNHYGLIIPLVGLAKRNEIIITSSFKEIVLPKASSALKLVMRIRDEAHRFAIAYHRKLRSKI